VLTNERADVRAVAQRRHLAHQEPRDDRRTAEDRLAAAVRVHGEATQRAEPCIKPLREAERELEQAEGRVRTARRVAEEAPIWRRRALTRSASSLADRLGPLQDRLTKLRDAAAPVVAELDQAEARVRDAKRDVTTARLSERLEQLGRTTPGRSLERGHGIEL
jgi:DNA repair exonuclease SbcCD ATPase subunit